MKRIYIKSAILATVLGIGLAGAVTLQNNNKSINEFKTLSRGTTSSYDHNFINNEYGVNNVNVDNGAENSSQLFYGYTPYDAIELEGANEGLIFAHGNHTWKVLNNNGEVVNEGKFDSIIDSEFVQQFFEDSLNCKEPVDQGSVVDYEISTATALSDGNVVVAGSLATEHSVDNEGNQTSREGGSAFMMTGLFNPNTGEFVDLHILGGEGSYVGGTNLQYNANYSDVSYSGEFGITSNEGEGYLDITRVEGFEGYGDITDENGNPVSDDEVFVATGAETLTGIYYVSLNDVNDPTDDTIDVYKDSKDRARVTTQVNSMLRGPVEGYVTQLQFITESLPSTNIVDIGGGETMMLANTRSVSNKDMNKYKPGGSGWSQNDYDDLGVEEQGLVFVQPVHRYFNSQVAPDAGNHWSSKHWFYFNDIFPGEWTSDYEGRGENLVTNVVELPTDQTLLLGTSGEWMIINNSMFHEYYNGTREDDAAAFKGVDYWVGQFTSKEEDEPRLTDAIAVNDNKNILFINEIGEWFLTDIKGEYIDQGYFGRYDNKINGDEDGIIYGYSSIIDLGSTTDNPFNFYVSGPLTSTIVSFDADGNVSKEENITQNIDLSKSEDNFKDEEFTLGETTYEDVENALWDSIVNVVSSSHNELESIYATKDNANFVFYEDESGEDLILNESDLIINPDVTFRLVDNNKDNRIEGESELITIEGLIPMDDVDEPELINVVLANISQKTATLKYDLILPEGFEYVSSKIVTEGGETLDGTIMGEFYTEELKPETTYSNNKLVVTVSDGVETRELTQEIQEFTTLDKTPAINGGFVVSGLVEETDGTSTLEAKTKINDDLGVFNPVENTPLFRVTKTDKAGESEIVDLEVEFNPLESKSLAKEYIVEILGIDTAYTYSEAMISLTGLEEDFVYINIYDEYGNDFIEPYIPNNSNIKAWEVILGTVFIIILAVILFEGIIIAYDHISHEITVRRIDKEIHQEMEAHKIQGEAVESEVTLGAYNPHEVDVYEVIKNDDDTHNLKGVIIVGDNIVVDSEIIKFKFGEEVIEAEIKLVEYTRNHYLFELDNLDNKIDYHNLSISLDGEEFIKQDVVDQLDISEQDINIHNALENIDLQSTKEKASDEEEAISGETTKE